VSFFIQVNAEKADARQEAGLHSSHVVITCNP
jgi:hypothetical protein